MFPLAALFFFVVCFMCDSKGGISFIYAMVIAGILTWLFVAAYWCLLWNSSVRWNARRTVAMLLATVGAVAAATITGFIVSEIIGRHDEELGVFVGLVMAIMLWLIATVFIWRETPAERVERIKSAARATITCPTCGYNLTGLNIARCPECGSEFTLDQLLALQPNNTDIA